MTPKAKFWQEVFEQLRDEFPTDPDGTYLKFIEELKYARHHMFIAAKVFDVPRECEGATSYRNRLCLTVCRRYNVSFRVSGM